VLEIPLFLVVRFTAYMVVDIICKALKHNTINILLIQHLLLRMQINILILRVVVLIVLIVVRLAHF